MKQLAGQRHLHLRVGARVTPGCRAGPLEDLRDTLVNARLILRERKQGSCQTGQSGEEQAVAIPEASGSKQVHPILSFLA
ncbi:MAG TPA: hypothetical protein VIL33_06875 [Rhodothermia bacterium]